METTYILRVMTVVYRQWLFSVGCILGEPTTHQLLENETFEKKKKNPLEIGATKKTFP